MTLADLTIKVGISGADAVNASLVEMRVNLRAVAGAADDAGSRVSRGFQAPLSNAIATVHLASHALGALRGMLSTPFEVAIELDTLTRSLATVEKSAEDVQQRLKELREIGRLPGIGFAEAVRADVSMRSAGLSEELSTRSMKALSNAIASAGGSKADLHEVIRQFSQMAGAGKLTGDEIRVIAERIPQIRQAISRAFGTTSTAEINKMGLTIHQIIGGIITEVEKLPRATGGIRNELDNLNDKWRETLLPLGRAFVNLATVVIPLIVRGMENLTSLFARLEVFSASAERMRATLAVIGGLVAGFAAYHIITNVIALANAFLRVAKAVKDVGIAMAIVNAAKGDMPRFVATMMAIGVGSIAAVHLNKQFNQSANNPDVPSGALKDARMARAGGANMGHIGTMDTVGRLVVMKAHQDALNKQQDALWQIARNTKDSADALTLRRQALGGGKLGQIGVTAAEMGAGGAAGGSARVPAGAIGGGGTYSNAMNDLQRAFDRAVQAALARKAGAGFAVR